MLLNQLEHYAASPSVAKTSRGSCSNSTTLSMIPPITWSYLRSSKVNTPLSNMACACRTNRRLQLHSNLGAWNKEVPIARHNILHNFSTMRPARCDTNITKQSQWFPISCAAQFESWSQGLNGAVRMMLKPIIFPSRSAGLQGWEAKQVLSDYHLASRWRAGMIL